LGGVEVVLPSLEALSLLLEIGCTTGGVQIQRHELRSGVSTGPVIDDKAFTWWREVVGIVGVVLWSKSREDLEEVAQRGDVGPRRA